ncbi:MAG TPA: glycosyltransferase family 2 protein [Mycobacteriales bacterium]|nr:glycosyltransferase family 2 protein [Mycobacteriales bacterium]
MTRVPVKVSVVVPVYNPGVHIQPLVDSLLRQSLAASEFEAIFVDDGSTDATPALLDRLAKEHSHFHVIHQPNSGWPGKPRNVGTDHARGDYVFYSDNDDWFGDEALERLYDCAVRNNSDIVIGKMVGHDRGVPRELFRRNRDRARFDNAPLQDSLTPHKLFRREFLDKHELRFPEGKRRLEDHVFVMKAFFAAEVISVLADYECYHHIRRADESNAGFDVIEPVSYYGYVRETVEVVLGNTEPGDLRDRLLRRFLRVELLDRLQGRRFSALPAAQRRRLFDTARALLLETMADSVDAGLPGRQRLQSTLLRAGDFEALSRLARWPLRNASQLASMHWDDNTIVIAWTAKLGRRGLLRRDGERVLLPAPRGRTAALDVTADVAKIKVELIAVDGERGEVILPTRARVEVTADGRLSVSGETTVGFGRGVAKLNTGFWTLRLRARALGWVADSPPLRWRGSRPVATLLKGGWLVRPSRTRRGAVAIDVGATATWLDADFALATGATVTGDSLLVALPAQSRGVETLGLHIGKQRLDAATTAAGLGAQALLEVPSQASGMLGLEVAGRRAPIDLGFSVTHNAGRLAARRPASLLLSLSVRRIRTRLVFAAASVVSLGARGRAAVVRSLRG